MPDGSVTEDKSHMEKQKTCHIPHIYECLVPQEEDD